MFVSGIVIPALNIVMFVSGIVIPALNIVMEMNLVQAVFCCHKRGTVNRAWQQPMP